MTDPITRLNVALEGRYRIERETGEGGMATGSISPTEVLLKVLHGGNPGQLPLLSSLSGSSNIVDFGGIEVALGICRHVMSCHGDRGRVGSRHLGCHPQV